MRKVDVVSLAKRVSKRTPYIPASGSITHTLQIRANPARPIAMNRAKTEERSYVFVYCHLAEPRLAD